MSKPNITLIDYENSRDVLFFFGAGTSISEGVPLQRDILKQIYTTADINITSSAPSNEIKKFISSNFYISENSFPTLESVFGYMDYFISRNECLGGEYTTHRIIELKEILIKLIHHIISKSKTNKKNIYKIFWENVSKVNKNISIITLNYDTLLDEAFDFLYPDSAYIDYCIELMNYHHKEKINSADWWDNPRKPILTWKEKTPTPIKIIKAHGSLNWKYCNCCNQVLLTAWNTNIDLNSLDFKEYIQFGCGNLKTIERELVCPIDGNKFNTLIVPPSYIKNLAHPTVNRLLDEAAIEIRKAKAIVFIGYSLPEADVHIKALFKKNLTNNTKIHVVDPYLNDSIKSSYNSLACELFFHSKSFEQFADKELKEILEPSEQYKLIESTNSPDV